MRGRKAVQAALRAVALGPRREGGMARRVENRASMPDTVGESSAQQFVKFWEAVSHVHQ